MPWPHRELLFLNSESCYTCSFKSLLLLVITQQFCAHTSVLSTSSAFAACDELCRVSAEVLAQRHGLGWCEPSPHLQERWEEGQRAEGEGLQPRGGKEQRIWENCMSVKDLLRNT